MKRALALAAAWLWATAAIAQTLSAGGTPITINNLPITGGTANQLLFDNNGVVGEITKGNSCVYLTNGSGVPSCATTLPSGLTIPGFAPLASPAFTGLVTIQAQAAGTVVVGSSVNQGIGFRSSSIDLITNATGMLTSQGSGIQVNTQLQFSLGSTTSVSATSFLTETAAATLQHGDVDAASPVAQTVKFQSVVAGTSNTAGVDAVIVGSLSTGTGVGGKLINKVAKTGTSGTAQNSAFPMLTINPGGAATATIQFGDGSNFTTYDSCTGLTTSATGVIQCTVSAMRFKDAIGSIKYDAGDLDLLRPAVWSYKPEFQQRFGDGVHVGLYADDVARMDPRCAVYEKGEIKNYEDRCVIAHLVATMQAMKSEIEELKRAH